MGLITNAMAGTDISPYQDLHGKHQVACPKPQDAIVIAAFGQSNGSNWEEVRHEHYGNNVYNYYKGQCYIASDPMLGADGTRGSIWVPFAEKVVASTHKKVVIAPFGIGSTSVAEWADSNSKLNQFGQQNMNDIAQTYPNVNAFFWIQGEQDRGSNGDGYEANLKTIIQRTHQQFPKATFFISATTYCAQKNNRIIHDIQTRVATNTPGVKLLGDTDLYTEKMYRYDDCHLSVKGIDAVTSDFAKNFLEKANLN